MKRITIILILVSVIISLVLLINKTSNMENDFLQPSNVEESNFEFSLMYNVDGKDFVNTFDNQLTVDTIDGSKTINFILTKDEKRRIKEKVLELEILDEDYSKLPYSGRHDDNKGIYELVIQDDNINFRVYWTSNYYPPIGKLIITDNNVGKEKNEDRYSGEFGKMNKLWDLKIYIIEIIVEREEYKALPPHKMYQ